MNVITIWVRLFKHQDKTSESIDWLLSNWPSITLTLCMRYKKREGKKGCRESYLLFPSMEIHSGYLGQWSKLDSDQRICPIRGATVIQIINLHTTPQTAQYVINSRHFLEAQQLFCNFPIINLVRLSNTIHQTTALFRHTRTSPVYRNIVSFVASWPLVHPVWYVQ